MIGDNNQAVTNVTCPLYSIVLEGVTYLLPYMSLMADPVVKNGAKYIHWGTEKGPHSKI